jgi:hypothetical protein
VLVRHMLTHPSHTIPERAPMAATRRRALRRRQRASSRQLRRRRHWRRSSDGMGRVDGVVSFGRRAGSGRPRKP